MVNNHNYLNVIAIDGPCGSGKSEIAKQVASKLNIVYIDTGAMYRGLGLVCHQEGVPFEEGEQMESFLERIDMRYGVSEKVLIEVNGVDLTPKIREHHVSNLASKISKLSPIRNFLLDFQRNLGKERNCVMEGRDIGTVIFPDAFCKIFLTATPAVRAQRRLLQLRENGDHEVTFEQVAKDLEERDRRDMGREVAPLKQAEDAVLLDSSDLSREEVIQKVCDLSRARARDLGINLL